MTSTRLTELKKVKRVLAVEKETQLLIVFEDIEASCH